MLALQRSRYRVTRCDICILGKSQNATLLVRANLMGDHAVVRCAIMPAGEGDLVEVWRGMTCIYSPGRESVH
jgi:hypothetical protein